MALNEGLATFSGTQVVYLEENDEIVACISALGQPGLEGALIKIEYAPGVQLQSVAIALFEMAYAVCRGGNIPLAEMDAWVISRLVEMKKPHTTEFGDAGSSDIPF